MYVYKHSTFEDGRGSYTPISLNILNLMWDQCSISVNTHKFTFRGLHYQNNPRQTKYIKVIKGRIVDFVVDIETGEVDYAELNSNESVLITNNKAHGFLTLEPNTIVAYLSEGLYNPNEEHSIVWSTIDGVKNVINKYIGSELLVISDKDMNGK